MNILDTTTRSIIGYLYFLYNIETRSQAQNTPTFTAYLTKLNETLSQPVEVWSQPNFKAATLRSMSGDLESGIDNLDKCLMALGVSPTRVASA